MAQRTGPIIQRLEQNFKGRDFVVGDIHGGFTLLKRAMEDVNFDPSVDRLLSPGDLVDRGPESHLAKDWLEGCKLIAASGNHEAMLLAYFDDAGNPLLPPSMREPLIKNGMGWFLDLTPQQRVPHLQAFAKLPLVLEVPTERGLVGILHAEVPPGMDWPTFKSLLEREDPAVYVSCLEGRERVKRNDTRGVAGIGRLFVGHTIQWGGLSRLGNVYVVDTGAIFAQMGVKDTAALTIAPIVCRTEVLTARKPRALVHIAEDNAPSQLPFGTGPAYVQPAKSGTKSGFWR